MSHPLLYVRVDGYQLSPTVQAVMSEYVVASPDDIGRAAEKMGYVKRPVCEVCERTPGRVRMVNGKVVSDALGWSDAESSVCPSCGGSGFGRLAALDGIERLDLACADCGLPDCEDARLGYWIPLAALEGGDTP